MSEIKAHLFPFTTDHNGLVNSDPYLQVKKVDEEKQQFETVLMGRLLKGQLVSTGPLTQGRVFEKRACDREESDGETHDAPWTATNQTIDQFILWKKDTFPDEKDPRIMSLKSWIDIAQNIHEPIPLEKKE